MNEEEFYQYLLHRAYQLLSIRPRSEKELRDRLTAKVAKRQAVFSKDLITRIIDKLVQAKLLDDEAFTKWLVESRMRRGKKGIRFIQRELENFGIAREIINQAASGHKQDEKDSALSLIDKYSWRWQKMPRRNLRLKAWQFLTGRGYNPDTIRPAVDELLKKTYNNK
ncbi:regulatory protein RecX [Candidatus Gottesmanbacteria bacterium]|nr:regulatory protein RecX [Candidatus Gottesmanbacteria bacterium]